MRLDDIGIGAWVWQMLPDGTPAVPFRVIEVLDAGDTCEQRATVHVQNPRGERGAALPEELVPHDTGDYQMVLGLNAECEEARQVALRTAERLDTALATACCDACHEHAALAVRRALIEHIPAPDTRWTGGDLPEPCRTPAPPPQDL